MSETIHPTAVVHTATRLGPDVAIGPYAVIEDGVELGAGSVVRAHAVIRSGTVLGEHCVIDSHAVLGGLPQDLHFDPRTPSGVRLGDRVTVREGTHIHRASKEGQFTTVLDDAFVMSAVHVGHDSVIGTRAIVASNAILGGFTHIGDHAFVGGGAGFHQYTRVGESAMIGGSARITLDVPPFVMVSERNHISGLNLVGLRRRGFERSAIRSIKQAYHALYGESGNLRERAEALLAEPWASELAATVFLKFFLEGKRSVARPESLGQGKGGE